LVPATNFGYFGGWSLKLMLRTLIFHYEIVDAQTKLIKQAAGLLTIHSDLKMTLHLNWKWE
jgi:hypothetical protein